MGVKDWWLSNFGSEADHRQYIVHLGGSFHQGPKRQARWVRGKKAADEYARQVLTRYEGVLWVAIGPDYGGDPIRYYRDINNSIHRLEFSEEVPQPWVGSLFLTEPRHEPAAFVIAEDRSSAISRTKEALENKAFKAAWVNDFSGAGMGWIAGWFTDDLRRDENGKVVVRDLLEEQRLKKIASLKAELSELEGE